MLDRLRHQAFHDALTGLPNRRSFLERLDEACAAGGEGVAAIMFIDLDGFKAVNDTYGHQCGDEVLVETARRISRCVRAGDLVARHAGDEFTVLLTGPAVDRAALERIARAILLTLSQPITFGAKVVRVSASIGMLLRGEAPSLSGEALYARPMPPCIVRKSRARRVLSCTSFAIHRRASRVEIDAVSCRLIRPAWRLPRDSSAHRAGGPKPKPTSRRRQARSPKPARSTPVPRRSA
ncbi:hypothetical protein KBK24_0106125 [Burkholderia sp. K24]|nr:hypothetical protein KBK24_0106125 [Burkholderia sp. K24]